NLMNTGEPQYPRGEYFARKVLSVCGPQEQRAFWERLGLRLREEAEGRVYPACGQASAVLDALRLAMHVEGVDVVTGAHVRKIEGGAGDFTVHTGDDVYRADSVVITGGGMAQPKLGSDGSAVKLLESMGHRVFPGQPVLTQVMCDTRPLQGLSGIRVKAEVTVRRKDKIFYKERGEVLFADYGLSGVCMMNAAGFLQPGVTMTLNLLPGLGLDSVEEAEGELLRRRDAWAFAPMEQLLCGLCVPRLSSALCREAGISFKGNTVGRLTEREIARLAALMADFRVDVTGVKGFDQAQVTRGGAHVKEFDPETMQSRIVPGLYAAGEVLDVDGLCGGYNLMFAFGSGIIAGRSVEV
ncbi:MAG: aminoacetone oxidase family FAD-binding enzyme, partial [Clostridia bacterium]|nr:aminoacetone oxidase family FAD-binding enzyme [Clostridia bacterium]